MPDLSFPPFLNYLLVRIIFIGPAGYLRPINRKCGKGYLAWFYVGCFLLPILWVVDGLCPNVEFSVQPFDEFLYPFYLEVGWKGGFAVSYNADADSLPAAMPGFRCHD